MRIRSVIRSLFAFSATETRGFWVFIILLASAWSLFWYYQLHLKPITFHAPDDKKMLDSLYVLLMASDTAALEGRSANRAGENQYKSPTSTIARFPFDPNQVTFDELRKLGFSERLAKQLLAYRKAGGKFRYQADLLKLYDMSDSLYRELMPYISLPIQKEKSENKAQFVEKAQAPQFKLEKPGLQLDVNQADSATFTLLYGIGPVFAGRLVRFREALGGFVTADQLKEMYGMPPETFAGIRDNIYVADTFKPKPIFINRVEVEELARHPYLSFAQAKVLVAYRLQHGSFTRAEDLLKIHTFNEGLLTKLRPYIRFEE